MARLYKGETEVLNKRLGLALVGVLVAGQVHAAAKAEISGQVMSTSITYGTTGAVNRIDVQVFDSEHSNSTWTITCRRSTSTLGWCSGVVQGDSVVASGYFTYAPSSQVEVTYLGIKNPSLPLSEAILSPVCPSP